MLSHLYSVRAGSARLRWLPLVVASFASSGCSKTEGVVRIDGSSTVFPIMAAVGTQFQKAEVTKVAIGVSGTTAGFRRFCAAQIDVAAASRPIEATEIEHCARNGVEYIEVPIAYDGLSVLVSSRNGWAHSITVGELKKIWEPEAQGKVLRWNQVRADWPDKELHLYGAGRDSGTFDYFTEAIVHKQRSSRTDYKASEDDDELADGVARDELGLGFFGYMYYAKNKTKLKALAVDDENPANGDGPVAPSPATVRSGTYQPLSRPLFLYAAKKSLDRLEVASFVNFYLERGWKLVDGVGYIPLPASAYPLGIARVSARQTGSIFAGKGPIVGVAIDELLREELKQSSR